MAERASGSNGNGDESDADPAVSGSGPTRRTFLLTGGAAGAALLAGCETADGDLSIENLEVTQAIQHLNNSDEPDNSLPLVRGKRTFVRTYVDTGTAGSVSDVTGQLRVFVDGSELAGSPFAAHNGPITVPSSVDRSVTDDTLNFQFLIPDTGSATGAVTVRFVAEVTTGGSATSTAAGTSTGTATEDGSATMELDDVSFECHRSPAIAYVPIDYTYDDADPGESGLPDSSKILPGIGDDFLWHSFPIPEPPNYYRASTSPIELDEDVDTANNSLLSDLATTRTLLSPEPDFIYGWLPGNPFWGNGQAQGIGSGTAAFGNTEDGRYQRTFAHEIGHLLGLRHHSRSLDPEVGFYSSNPVHSIRTDSCDSTGDERTKCGELLDVMVPGQMTPDAWIDPDTYTHIANQDVFSDHSCPALVIPELPVEEYLFVTGTIARPGGDGAHSLNPVYELEGETKLAREEQEGSRRIELRDANGGVLESTAFEVDFHGSDAEEPLDEAAFDLALPSPDGTVESVVLLSEDEEVARIERSASAPEVDVTSPQGGASLSDQTLVSWEADDPDGDDLTYSIQYSPDGGESTVPVAVNLSASEHELDPTVLPGSEDGNGLVRVIATDGLNTTTAEVTDLSVPNKAPEVRITEPKLHGEDGEELDSLEVRHGRALIVSGHGYDKEDGFLEGQSLIWESSEDGQLGTGRSLQVTDLSRGTHTITLVGTDSDGNEDEDSIVVDVVE